MNVLSLIILICCCLFRDDTKVCHIFSDSGYWICLFVFVLYCFLCFIDIYVFVHTELIAVLENV